MLRYLLIRLGLAKPTKTLDDYAAEWGAYLREMSAPMDTRRLCAKLPPQPAPCPVCDPEAFRRAVIHEGSEP